MHPVIRVAAWCARLPKEVGSGNFGSNNRRKILTTEPFGMRSDVIRQMFCERYMAGVLYKDICRELGISPRTAGYWAKEMGLPRRIGGPRQERWMPGKKPGIR